MTCGRRQQRDLKRFSRERKGKGAKGTIPTAVKKKSHEDFNRNGESGVVYKRETWKSRKKIASNAGSTTD